MRSRAEPAVALIMLAVSAARAGAQPGSVCAHVYAQLDHSAVITRSAFRGTLTINNATEADYLTGVRVTVDIRDANGAPAGDRFQVRPPELVGIDDVNGNGQVAPRSGASAAYTIVPFSDAAPEAPAVYRIGGTLSYTVQGNNVSVDFFPATVTVLPNPRLGVKYFLERDVVGDDPLTPEVEASEPFSLGLMMSNSGAGIARNVEITSSLPEITRNDRDLLIAFQLVGTSVGATSFPASLAVSLGDVNPGTTAVARWLFTSTVQGRFRDFEASYRHIDGLGDPRASLIESLETFELAHAVRADRPDDGVPDFMTYPDGSKARTPDFIHLSQGPVEPVASVFDAVVSASPGTSSATIRVNDAPDAWSYIRVQDPYGGSLRLASVQRSDGKVILAGYNAWQTNRIIRKHGQEPSPDRHIHIFDRAVAGAPVEYTVRYVPDDTSPGASNWSIVRRHGAAGEAAIGIAAGGRGTEPRAGGVSTVRVNFSEPVLASTFSRASVGIRGLAVPSGMALRLEGIGVTTELDEEGTVGTIRFTPPLPDGARYCVKLQGITDGSGHPLLSPSVSFTTLRGDATGDGRVNGTDVNSVSALVGTDPIDPANELHARADINADGRIDQADVGFVSNARRTDAHGVADPCEATGDPGTPPPVGPGGYGSGPGPWRMTSFVDLGDPAGVDFSPRLVNSSGFKVGSVTLPDGNAHATLVQPTGETLDIGTLGGRFSVALGINDRNQVVGYSETLDGEVHAFRYTAAAPEAPGRMDDLGTMGGVLSWANGINTEGLAVGASTFGESDSTRAFVHDGELLVDLNELLPAPASYELVDARTIDDARRIRGIGLAGGTTRAFEMVLSSGVGPVIPGCRADINHDGIVSSPDFLAFLRVFLGSEGAGDFNGDGAVTSQDLLDFLAHFFAGC